MLERGLTGRWIIVISRDDPHPWGTVQRDSAVLLAAIWPGPVFGCPRCGRVSSSEEDLREGYCGACHDWTGPPGGAPR